MLKRHEYIKALREAGQYLPTLTRYRQHVIQCERMGVEPETFEKFADEVLNTPSENRDWLLEAEPVANYEPATRYAQYEMPCGDEMFYGTATRKK